MDTSAAKPPDRFRFSLRALLLFVTVVCLWLGWQSYRTNWAKAKLARENKIVAAINERIETPPAGTKVHHDGPLQLWGFRSVDALHPFSGRDYAGSTSIQLEIPKVNWQDRLTYVVGLRDHYVKDLQDSGLSDHDGGRTYSTENMLVMKGSLKTSVRDRTELNVLLVYTIAADFTDQRAEVFLQLFCIE
jgi:hypothetical protein